MKKIISLSLLSLFPMQALAQSGGVQVNLDVLDQFGAPSASQYSVPVQEYVPPAQTVYQAQPQQVVQAVAPAAGSQMAAETGLFGAEWSGRANFGAFVQSGNSDTQNIDADARVSAKWDDIYRASLRAEYIRQEDNDEASIDNRLIEGLFDYFFKPKWFANANARFEQDDIAGLDLRSTYGVAIGHEPYDRDDLKLKYQLGPSFLKEERSTGEEESSLAYAWQLDYAQTVWDDVIELFHNHQIFVPSDEVDRYVIETSTGARVPLRKSLVATFQIDHDIDRGAPAGRSEDDTRYGFKLGYEW